MRVRVVDFRRHSGGGRRFFIQLTKALQQSGEIGRLEVVSHGEALADIRASFAEYGIEAKFTDIPWDRRFGLLHAGYQVPARATMDCDIAWFPWLHHHRPPVGAGARVVASFHDGLPFAEPALASRFPDAAAHERETATRWVRSGATIVCSSRYWAAELEQLFGCAPERFETIPISGDHAGAAARAEVDTGRWPHLAQPFVLFPAHTSWHKNHEVLFEAYARAGMQWPLVLTGAGSDLVDHSRLAWRLLRRMAVAAGLRPPHRAPLLWKLARRLGMSPGATLFPMGKLGDAEYDAVASRAACVVMPTLGEGGGSFPVEEAVLKGIPVICSDIPVLREHMARLGAEVLWSDPRDADSLAARLKQVARDHEAIRASAQAQVARLRIRRWSDVAADYVHVFKSVLARAEAA